MMHAAGDTDIRGLMQIQGPVTHSLDGALEYLRARGLRLLPSYVVAVLPLSIGALFLIDAISAEHRSGIFAWCWWLVPATLWRWAWLARVQQSVQRDLQARPGLPLRRRLLWILVIRLYAIVALTWGSMLILPSFYGFFGGSFTAPLLLERDGAAPREIWRMLGWVHHSAARLVRALLSLSLFTTITILAVYITQRVLVEIVLPSLLGVESSGIDLTIRSWTWLLCWLYFLFLAIDFGWTVAAVFLYYDSQSRRTGSDLRARMRLLPFETMRGSE